MRAKTVEDADGKFYGVRITCPGCKGYHLLPVTWLPAGRVESPHVVGKPHWTFNGDMERPTFAPSILSRYTSESKGERVCHSFVREGRIEFLNDCTHALAGQTVDLPDIEEVKT